MENCNSSIFVICGWNRYENQISFTAFNKFYWGTRMQWGWKHHFVSQHWVFICFESRLSRAKFAIFVSGYAFAHCTVKLNGHKFFASVTTSSLHKNVMKAMISTVFVILILFNYSFVSFSFSWDCPCSYSWWWYVE